ncbi:hypothetical protein CDD81_4272 [Ophiocordyceps australis]|uniref:RAD50-interacting protein 1 n=1 Tax=Ophiocordyceps australis TaxID=1399860 RepID=A0A2C5XV93_9HYPO|nr:hypothetical protein CDD81_4272 [Ophiocordyceps australis]
MSSQGVKNAPCSLDMRVEDFLDDRLQSATDLDALDDLVASVETQRNQLQSQLDTAAKELDEARHTAQDGKALLQSRIDDFNKLEQSIHDRIQAAAASEAPNEAIARLQLPMGKLQAVKLAQQYLVLLANVERLGSEARSHLPASPRAALQPYTRLKELSMQLGEMPGSHGLHLVAHVENVTQALWHDMKRIMSGELEAILALRSWPRIDPQAEMDDEWMACIEKLVDLQMPEIVHSSTLVSLLPFDVMTAIFVAEFRFHFLSDKPTSSLQAVATHCFPWFLSTIDKWQDFFRDNLGHLLAGKFEGTPVGSKMAYLDPVSALVTAMLPVMQEKVNLAALEAMKNPPLFSTFMPQLLTLDDNIRSMFGYDGGDVQQGWPGLSADVLDKHFDEWFRTERAFAFERFEHIIESQDARKIDFDFAVGGKMKPTYAAVLITDLLCTVTSKYARLRKLRYKTRFLTHLELDILDEYHDRLGASLEAYQSMTSTIGRTLHGATKDELAAVEGIGALETLCKVIGSADHVANTLMEWSDEEFFAQLWQELQVRHAQGTSQDGSTGILYQEGIQGRVPNGAGRDSQDSGIFDETAAAYITRRKAAEKLLVGALADSHTKAFRAYMTHVQWTTIGDAAIMDDASQLSVTPELDEPLRTLKSNFEFLCKALSSASLRRVWCEALDKLQDMLWNGVLLRQSFTTLGAAQFAHDGTAIFSLIEHYIPGASAALDALRQGLQLVSLPAEPTKGISLKEASDRAFASNQEARAMLQDLGLDALTPMNARYILNRRIENSENVGW